MAIMFPRFLSQVKGFLAHDEGRALAEMAFEHCRELPALEVGSYCGKSTIYLASACQAHGSVVYAVDHHRGSEEHQPGEEYHDPALYDSQYEVMDSFREFRRNMVAARVEDAVVPIVARSEVAAKLWHTPLGLAFIDGGHSELAAQTDYSCWAPHVVSGGILAIHDLFPDPTQGGQAPINIWRQALASGEFEEVAVVKTLGFLRRH
ncbi:class I SAM-dependent methyltransferase [Halioxenophilus aromaticivorans]|uniref:Class I SAM-dependent methyltransferase n=1 Tax=Halioxenophilus aromaticivorans TaxID=1306992 RepID=A0AAV3U3Y2_9ALTE